MCNEKIRLVSILQLIDVDNVSADFNKRMYVQKSIFLLKRLGMKNLNYSYNWYIRGPYSPELARDYYSYQNILSWAKLEGPKVTEDDDTIIPKFQNLKAELERMPHVEKIHLKLELIASMLYLYDKYTYDDEQTAKENILESIRKMKPHFVDWPLEDYWEIMKNWFI